MTTYEHTDSMGGRRRFRAARRSLSYGFAATLLLSCAPAALHAEGADKDEKIRKLESMMIQMQSQIQSLKAAVGEERAEGRRTREKVRVVSEKAYALPPPGPAFAALPPGAVPAFVTADKKLQFGALTITPGGFIAADGYFRTRTLQTDNATQFQNIPFGPQANTNEFRFSARQSRIAALVEAPITPSVLVSGYGEFDFQSSAVNSNENESDSFVPRIRNLYGALDLTDYGIHMLAGQAWSLSTLNSKGITPRNEVTPPTIDAGYVAGFVYKRQPQIRLTKDFGQKLWLSLSAEEPQNTLSGCTPGVNTTTIPVGASGTSNAVTCQLLGTGNLNGIASTTTTAFSLNHVPDIIGKAAYEAKFANRDIHFEGFGMYRDLYDRAEFTNNLGFANAYNHDTTGYGVGGGVIVPVIPARLDFQVSGLTGKGIGSYGTAQFSDATFNPNGSEAPIPETMLLGGLTAHVTPSIDLWGFAGVEEVQPKYFTTSAAGSTTFTAFGYGAPTANNSGCFNTVTVGTCSGQTKRVFELTGGMWDKLYKGSFGEVRVGLQYGYIERELFQGNGGGPIPSATAPLNFAPKQNENIVLTSFRYYPFQ